MDPWYYNRLSNASAKSQSGSGASHSDYHQPLAGHQPAPGSPAAVSSAPQLLLQAAHNSGHSIPPPFSPGFLTPNPYEFPLFPNASQYAVVSQHRALASAISSAKPTVESEMSHRENFSPAHHPSLAAASGSSFFEHQNAAPSSLGWSHQPNPQLPSPFGVLPHESVSNTSSGPPSKPASADYANAFNAYSSSHSLNHQLSDYKNYSDMKKESRSQSPTNSSKVSSASPSSVPYYQGGAVAGNNYASSESNNRSSFSSSSKYSGSSVVQPPQSCIVASPSVTQPSKDYRQQHSAVPVEGSTVYPDSNASRNKQASSRSQNFVPSSTKSSPIPVQTKAQTKVYPDVASSTEASHRSKTPLDTNQSSPISLSMMDSSTSHRYSSESNVASKEPLSGQSQRVSGNQHPYQQSLSHHAAAYYANSGGTHEANYHRSKSVESAFVSATNQNALECVNRRTSPHTSQSSPLGHAHSPAYPMYNSPMSSLPSPSPHQLSESTNPCQSGSTSYKASIPMNNSTTPLDASVIRPQGGPAHSVTYPSVITRAVATPEPSAKPVAYNETRAYDHDSTRYSKQCWESGSDRVSTSTQQQRDIATNMAQPQHSSRTSERQQPCYDSAASQASHDLSSFRGDPMSLVKNLQSLQQHQEQTCQAQPPTDDSRPGSKTPGGASSIPPNSSGKRRKSSEKQVSASNSMEYYNNRIPPPAHLNVALQQQQNGSYFPNYLSSPSTSRAYSGSQTSLHHTSNSFMGSQSQGLYMSPYFSPFHLPTSQSSGTPGDYQSTSSHSRALHSASEPNNEHVPSATVLPQVQETVGVETSKVVIPNIEEELSYLVGPILMMKSEQGRKNSVASGFEASYLKFLQGERESSPPPSRGAKKTWYKTKNQQNDPPKSVASCNTPNGGNTAIETVQQSQSEKGKTPAYDVEDDPRYFPLPKTDAQRRSLDSSDSDSDPGTAAKSQAPKTPDRKPIAAVAPRTATKQATKGAAPPNSQPGKRGRKKKPEVPVPRRETSRRKAKEKGSILLNADDPEDPDDDSHSDSDPAWTPVPFKAKPQNIESSEDENVKKKSHKKAAKLSGCVRKRARLASSDCDQTSEEDSAKAKKRGSKHRKKSESHQGVSTGSGDGGGGDDDPELYSFKVGEFVLMKSDLGLKWPPIWRVDGKTLLQKFESFAQKGETLYRNISTYSGWTPQNRDLYISIQVKFRLNSKTEKVVEFLRNESMENNDDILESLVKTTAQFQENFEVYIQTLISQALDSNFLTEIFQERDEYFLTNVKIVDDIVADRRQRFLRIVKWRTELEASIATWPCYNVMFELGEEFCKNCAACDKPRVAARVLLYGQPYNSTTLEGCQADPKLVSEKDFLTCRPCLSKIELYNKVAHQKYLMFIECAKRVQEKRLADSSKDTTVILNELLADDIWLHQLFRNVRLSWAEIDRLEKVSRKE